MDAVKGIPYGVARFEEVRNENFYYVDKTTYLPLLEDTGKYLFLIRPRRFGKSVFVSMMQVYYDIAKADKFDRLFGGLWIHGHPTPLKNSFQVVYFDFSLISGRSGRVGGQLLRPRQGVHTGWRSAAAQASSVSSGAAIKAV